MSQRLRRVNLSWTTFQQAPFLLVVCRAPPCQYSPVFRTESCILENEISDLDHVKMKQSIRAGRLEIKIGVESCGGHEVIRGFCRVFRLIDEGRPGQNGAIRWPVQG